MTPASSTVAAHDDRRTRRAPCTDGDTVRGRGAEGTRHGSHPGWQEGDVPALSGVVAVEAVSDRSLSHARVTEGDASRSVAGSRFEKGGLPDRPAEPGGTRRCRDALRCRCRRRGGARTGQRRRDRSACRAARRHNRQDQPSDPHGRASPVRARRSWPCHHLMMTPGGRRFLHQRPTPSAARRPFSPRRPCARPFRAAASFTNRGGGSLSWASVMVCKMWRGTRPI